MTAQTFLSRDPAIPQDQRENLPAVKYKKKIKKIRNGTTSYLWVDIFDRVPKNMPAKSSKEEDRQRHFAMETQDYLKKIFSS